MIDLVHEIIHRKINNFQPPAKNKILRPSKFRPKQLSSLKRFSPINPFRFMKICKFHRSTTIFPDMYIKLNFPHRLSNAMEKQQKNGKKLLYFENDFLVTNNIENGFFRDRMNSKKVFYEFSLAYFSWIYFLSRTKLL